MVSRRNDQQAGVAIGIDVGGTKIAGGLVSCATGRAIARRQVPTRPERGGDEVLRTVADMIRELADELRATRPDAVDQLAGVGLGVAELVSPDGQIVSEATIRWKGLDVAGQLSAIVGCPAYVDADVRAAARGEALWGAGRGRASFIYVTIGTGISSCLVLEGTPYTGSRGLTGTLASAPTMAVGATAAGEGGDTTIGVPLEAFAAGPALAQRYAQLNHDFRGGPPEVMELARSGESRACRVVRTAGRAMGAAIGQLINTLDPECVVIGGGLGLATGPYREELERASREFVWSELHRDVPLLSAQLGNDAGWLGAAAGAARWSGQE